MTTPRLSIASSLLLVVSALGCASSPSSEPTTNEGVEPTRAHEADESAPETPLQRLPGTKVSLSPPVGFVPADTYPGFVHPERGSSLIVIEADVPYVEIVHGFDDSSAAASQGLEILEAETRAQGEYEGRLLRIHQRAEGLELDKWMWVFGDARRTVMVMATCANTTCDDELPLLRASLLTARWDPSLELSPTEGLNFHLDDLGGLKISGRVGNSLGLNETGELEFGADEGLNFIVGPGMDYGPVEDREAFARKRVAALPYDAIELEALTPLELDGLEGLRVLATAKLPSGEPVFLFTVLLFEPDNYWIMGGAARLELREAAQARCMQIAAGFRRK